MSSTFRWNVMQKLVLSIWAMVTLILLFIVILLVREIAASGRDPLGAFQPGESAAETAPLGSSRIASLGEREIQLYFAAADGRSLAPEKQILPFSESSIENARAALTALIAGPKSGIAPILPPSVHLKSLFLRPDGELVINFSRELQADTRGGSALLESLMVQGVVQTVSQSALQNPQEPQIRRVRFLIEDEPPTDAFPAHIDLSQPVSPDGQWLAAQR
ncbi:MAG: GerMN domain-containing protein [Candidatus Hydrogenedentes bacterium]|nr:GerMN domain-containing protein [Candidatus Hydrogenedentota bacterium]